MSVEHYSTTDSDYDEDDNFIGARPATSHEMYRMYDCYSSSAYLRFHNAIGGCIDRWAAEAERRAIKRLKAIGRRAYALELVKGRTVIAHLFARTPMTYSIPINTAATAADSTDWKSYEQRMAEAAAKHPPQVWDGRDCRCYSLGNNRPTPPRRCARCPTARQAVACCAIVTKLRQDGLLTDEPTR
jgi:hypothetical protein